MNEQMFAIVSLASIGALLSFLFWLYRDYCVDSFRQKLFALRDDLFDEAANGNIDFNSAAYGMLRSTINGQIRFAHRISLPHFIFISRALDKHLSEIETDSFTERFDRNLALLDEGQQKLLREYFLAMHLIIIRHLLLGSPLLLVTLVVPVTFMVAANRAIKQAFETFRPQLERLDSLALVEGET